MSGVRYYNSGDESDALIIPPIHEYHGDQHRLNPNLSQDYTQQLKKRVQQLETDLTQLQIKKNTYSWSCKDIATALTFVALIVAVLALAAAMIGVQMLNTQQTKQSIEQMKDAMYEVIGAYQCNESVPGTSTEHVGVVMRFETNINNMNYQCMPTEGRYINYNQNDSYYSNTTVTYANLVKYNTFRKENNLTSACALCRISGRTTIKILPATNVCPEGWTKQYHGYLMTGGLCVHIEMDGQRREDLNEHISYIQHEVVLQKLGYTNYQDDLVLSCVVCSK